LGKAVSAVVTAQTRSGTNQFHGSAYDFRTGNANYARDPYSVTPGAVSLTNPSGLPPGLKNRFGGSIGGPAIKDRFFFFGNYEAQRQKVGTSATDTLPTSLLTETALGNEVGPSGIAGADFSEYKTQLGATGTIYNNTGTAVAPGCGSTGAVGQPFPCNVIPKALLSPQTLALLKILEPSTKGIGLGTGIDGSVNGLDENFKESGTGLFNSNQWTERADYTINEKMHAFLGHSVRHCYVRSRRWSRIRHQQLWRQLQRRERQPRIRHGHRHQPEVADRLPTRLLPVQRHRHQA
jgi:hypothetical protein